ncbi:ABC transporter substrate-binding protein [Cucumibacter marinus]|uniref:ABC transporter substrate-binding protein n=1 Tax=Cucumibacter marinus TaxID=1121252 RepID=UPI0004032993|nr:ABC transporter substrate-binding protein [Cucumibacter marinus]
MKQLVIALLVGMLTLAPATAQEDAPFTGEREDMAIFGPDGAERTLTIRSTTDIAVFAPVLEAFLRDRTTIRVVYEQWGSNDLYDLSRRDCAADGAPGADLVISSAIDLQMKLANDGCAAEFHSPGTDALPLSRNWRSSVFGVTEEPAVMIYNTELVSEAEAPASRFDLIDLLRPNDSRFRGRVATYDIEASGLGYLFAFVDSAQANTFGRLLEAFGRSGAVATCCSAEIIDAVSDGRYLIAYNVLGSYALARAEENPRIGIRAPTDYTLILSRAALVPQGAEDLRDAGAFIDFMLSAAGREALTRSRLVVRLGQDPDADLQLTGGPSTLRPIALSPALLAGLDQHKRRLFTDVWRQNLASE